ncbi:hypothetical protein CEXT_519111 [Caerostris extrusa]|uniref:Uncharacterized protein n=1 Tax=Caerostris extrusa TaxID=172846 RepID=A0AAV4RL62_CAEEX|nr:hypothetical protein CEXT_519111 [Caerostris extrusa]
MHKRLQIIFSFHPDSPDNIVPYTHMLEVPREGPAVLFPSPTPCAPSAQAAIPKSLKSSRVLGAKGTPDLSHPIARDRGTAKRPLEIHTKVHLSGVVMLMTALGGRGYRYVGGGLQHRKERGRGEWFYMQMLRMVNGVHTMMSGM